MYGSLEEDLALEHVVLAEAEAESRRAWRARQYKLAQRADREAARARERIAELEERARV